jgi:hypothetical protein
VALTEVWSVPFESCLPVRGFPPTRGSANRGPVTLARLADGSALVLDCRPVECVKPRDRAAFEVTRTACARHEQKLSDTTLLMHGS